MQILQLSRVIKFRYERKNEIMQKTMECGSVGVSNTAIVQQIKTQNYKMTPTMEYEYEVDYCWRTWSAKSARGIVTAELMLRRGIERHTLKTGCGLF